MRCPKCGSRDDKVIDSRQSRDASSIRRRRECLKCKYRFTTYEEIERSDLRVVKRNRTHEPFDRRKLATNSTEIHARIAQHANQQESWSRLRKNFPISAQIRDNSSSSAAIGYTLRSRGRLTKLVIPAGGSPIM